MPRAGYFICSASGALDQFTNAVSLYNLIESIGVKTVRVPQPDVLMVVPISMRITAMWLSEPEDSPEEMFVTQIVAFIPGHERPILRADFPAFKFQPRVRRFVLPEVKLPPNLPISTGLLRFECRIRRVGEAEWAQRQEYCIVVEAENLNDPQETAGSPSLDTPTEDPGASSNGE